MNRTFAARFGMLGAIAILALAGWSAAANAQTSPTVSIATLPIDSEAVPYDASDLGIFKKHGLDATVVTVPNASTIASAVLGGTYDIGQTDITTLALAHEKGLPLVAIAPGALYNDAAPTTACVVPASSTVRTAKELNNATIAVSGLYSFTRLIFAAWLDKNGADLATIKFIELPFPSIPAALVSGRVAAGTLSEPYLDRGQSFGEVRLLAKCGGAIAPQMLVTVYFTTADYAKAHPDVVKNFGAAIFETARWANGHHDESARILEKYTKTVVTPTMTRPGYAERLNLALVQPQIDAAARYGVLKTGFSASDLFAPGIASP